MIEADSKRDQLYDKIIKIHHLDWNLPQELAMEGRLKKVTSTDPYDSVEAVKRVFASLPPKVKLIPLKDDEANKALANERERNLKWQLRSANRLRSETVENEFMESAILFKGVAGMVLDLEWQLKVAKSLKKNTTAIERALRTSRFAINTYAPRDVHVRRSNYGVNTVLLCQKRTPHSILDEWGDVGRSALAKLDEEAKSVYYFDLMDGEIRLVYFTVEMDGNPNWIMNPTEHELDFDPWCAILGGTSMESDPSHQFKPMLYPLVQTDMWENLNILDTLFLNDVVAVASAPKFVEEGNNPDYAEIDFTDPAKPAKAPPGNVLKPIQISEINRGVAELRDRLSMQMEFATVSKSIRGGMLPSGMSFSAYNLNMQVAENQMRPAKTLCERGLAEIFTKMLLWANHTGVPLVAYGTDKQDLGREYRIEPDEIDTTAIYIDVELTPTTPTDEMRRANVGSLLAQLGASSESILEQIGFEDPQAEMEKRYFEDEMKFMDDAERQGIMMQMQAGIAAQQQQQQMEQQMAAQMAAQQATVQGQGANPAMGGMPNVQMAPPGEVIREEVQGVPRNEMEEGL